KEETSVTIIRKGDEWIAEYKPFLNSPEGYGVRYLVAEAHFLLARETKEAPKKKEHLAHARELCRELERNDNDFQLKAQRIKFDITELVGGFNQPVNTLTSFDDCLNRAQYEASQVTVDAKKPPKSPEEAGKIRKERQKNV